MNVEKPDISEINLIGLKERPFSSRSEYRITISDQAHEIIYKHAQENTTVEICGVLIGDVFKDTLGPYLEITDAIKGEHAANQAGQVTFTQETWSYINDIKDSKFSEKRIVGWYHSHPQFGIFLSAQDIFIHKNFFNLPWQVAFVIDPVTGDEGFFVWHSGKPIRVEQYWVGGDKKSISGKIVNSQRKITNEAVEATSKNKGNRLQAILFLVGLLIVVSLQVLNFLKMEHVRRLEYEVKNELKQVRRNKELEAHMKEQQILGEKQSLQKEEEKKQLPKMRNDKLLDEGNKGWVVKDGKNMLQNNIKIINSPDTQ